MKKKLLLFAAIIIVLVSIACLSLSAAEVAIGTCGEKVTWRLDTGTGLLTISGEGEMRYGKFNDSGGYSVSSLDIPWYNYRSDIKSCVIEDGVTYIDAVAFYGCTSLESITIPDSVTSMGPNVFSYCGSLTNINISANNTAYIVVDGVLFNKNKTELICYPAGKTQSTYTVPSTVTTIEVEAFSVCSSLESVTIPDSVTKINNRAFYGCTSLKNINVDANNTAYTSENGVLFNKNKTELICYPAGKTQSTYTIPDSVTSIGQNAFLFCESLEDVTIPDSVTSIGISAFRECTSLTSVTIPNSVASIGSSAFSGCTLLASVTIPNSVVSISGGAFSGCTLLETIYFAGTEDTWNLRTSGVNLGYNVGTDTAKGTYTVMFGNKIEIVASGTCGDNLTWVLDSDLKLTISGTGAMTNWKFFNASYAPWYDYAKSIKTVVIEDGVTSIGDYAFYNFESLTSLAIPKSVDVIGASAFFSCRALTSVKIPNGVTKIPHQAFTYCRKLTTVYLPTTIVEISTRAFEECVLLETITYAGTEAFWNNITKDSTWNKNAGKNTTNGTYTVVLENNSVVITTLASGTCGDNVTWALTSDGTLTISGEGDMKDWTYTSKAPWYKYRSNIKTIVIEDGVANIGDYAFYYCGSFTSITIPDSVTSIGNAAFSRCELLTSITIPDSITSIGGSAFGYCSSLTSITIPDSVTSIDGYAFSGCDSLESVTIGKNLTSIGVHAFQSCSSLTSINVSDENNNFADIDGVLFDKKMATILCYPKGKTSTSYTIPDGVTSIGEYAFYYCSSLESVHIPESVISICDYAFYFCSSLTGVIIPEGVESIGEYAFEGCDSLASVTISDTVTSICGYAFYRCDSLESVTIPASVRSIGDRAFFLCDSLTSINVSDENNNFADIDGVLFDKKMTTILCYPIGKTSTSYTIPNGVTRIGDDVFFGCISLESVTIPDSVTSIGDCAFSECSLLKSVDIPDGVTSIGVHTFSYCTSLESVNIPDGVTRIGYRAFLECTSLTSVNIPNGVTSIGVHTFSKCSSLTSVTIPDSLTSIADGLFSYCDSLTSVTIGNRVASIGSYAFSECSSLEKIIYTGSRTNWDSVTKGSSWNDGVSSNITVICADDLFTVVFKNYDGTVISNISYHYGDIVTVPEDPSRAEDDKYSYRFVGWDKEVATYCTGDVTYTAKYNVIVDFLFGDANGDEKVDNKDLVRIKKYLAGLDYDTGISTEKISAGADANGDGDIDNKDLVRLKKYLAAYDYDTGTSDVVLGPTA